MGDLLWIKEVREITIMKYFKILPEHLILKSQENPLRIPQSGNPPSSNFRMHTIDGPLDLDLVRISWCRFVSAG
jgi:hypothetical protein